MAKNKKIWIADDDESIRFVLESGLSEAGFNVSTFEDGNEVVNKLDIESPHLLLTDLKMPGRDGMDLLETFRNEHQKIPIIIMTAHSDLDTTVEAFEAGAWDYIAKPFDLNTAIEKINKAISEKKNVQKKLSEKEINNIKKPILDMFAHKSEATFASAHLWDDGIIDPRKTREVVALSLEIAMNAPVQDTKFGVFRM